MNDKDHNQKHKIEDTKEKSPSLQEQIVHLTEENKNIRDMRLRALADVENLRRRADNAHIEGFQQGAIMVIRPLLNILDDLERAMENAGISDKKTLISGVESTVRSLLSLLESQGVEAVIVKEGDRFDPVHHEALFQKETAEIPEGSIVQIVRKGYKAREQLLRAAGVAVAKHPPKAKKVEKSP